MGDTFRPIDHQTALPVEDFIKEDKPEAEAVPLDVAFVGGGPAGLAGAIELARLVKADNEAGGESALGEVEIGVLEKSAELGEHCLSGAVVNPVAFRELFPELSDEDFPFRTKVEKERVYLVTEGGSVRLPTPPTMNNEGNYVASICESVRWLGEKAESLGVNLFTGFPCDSLLVDGQRVIGVRTTPGGLTKDGSQGAGYIPPMDLTAKVTVIADGTRGPLGQAYRTWQKIDSPNPQIFALGVKELWEVKKPLDAVIHTLGWPLPKTAFGGSFMYPMAEDLVAIGLVVGLDYDQSTLDVHGLLQKLKLHPLFRPYLDGGEMVEWGAKTIPEGGYYSLPTRLYGDGVISIGDTAGFVDVPSLKGIHYAMMSGILAARSIFQALKKGDTSRAELATYDKAVHDSFIASDMHRTRNMRLAFKSGFYSGGIKAGLMTLSGGSLFGNKIDIEEDAAHPKRITAFEELKPDGSLTFGKLDGVFRSGNNTRDDMPSHLSGGDDVSEEIARFYEHMCPAAVYEVQDGKLTVNFSNCVDCKTTDVLGPRWRPREGGAGTKYKRM
jgi:electron-transferring-flavoprotein dehydrogenase